jgi:dynein light chain LC8-type
MDPASEELERRSRYLSVLVRRTKLADPPQPEPEAEAVETKAKADVEPELKAPPRPHVGGEGKGGKEEEAKAEEKERTAVAVKARGEVKEAEGRKVAVCVRAVRVAVEAVAAMPRLESKRLALALKKVTVDTGQRRFSSCLLEPVVFVCGFVYAQLNKFLNCYYVKIKCMFVSSMSVRGNESETNAYTDLWLTRFRKKRI